MVERVSDELTKQFYKWESSGRGWKSVPFQVDIEPPFVPFIFFELPPRVFVDDGRKKSLRSVFNRLKENMFPLVQLPAKINEAEPSPFSDDELVDLVAFRVSLPKQIGVNQSEMQRLLVIITSMAIPISFEVIADRTEIFFQFVFQANVHMYLRNQIQSHFPNAIVEVTELNQEIVQEGQFAMGVDYGLRQEFMRSICTGHRNEFDPYQGLFSIFENLEEGEKCILQILFKGTQNPWSESIIRSVCDNRGDSFFIDDPEMVPLAKEKVSSPIAAVVIRSIAIGTSEFSAKSLSDMFVHSLILSTRGAANELMPLPVPDIDADAYFQDVVDRKSHRIGMLLNIKELSTLVHFPSPSLSSKKLIGYGEKSKCVPNIAKGHDFVIGVNKHQGKLEAVTVSTSQRFKHMHIIGATGMGKSTLMLDLIVQDIEQYNGVAVLDPHGDLIEQVLQHIPPERANDVIVLDPADTEFPLSFNILSAHSEIEKTILSSDLVALFRRFSTSWGDQMNSVFANAILAILESDSGGTLLDLRRFLIEKNFRNSYLTTITDPSIKYYWQKEFPLLKTSSVGPILTRLDAFLRPKVIRNMVAQHNCLNFENILNSQKILLVKLAQGLMGEENSSLLGAFVVAKIHQAAIARQSLSAADRSSFFLYVDEFQHFITPSMSAILSGARKYHLGLILAHQDMQQVQKYDGEIAASILSNAGTRICFKLGDADAKKLSDGFSYFESNDLQNLNVGEALVRIEGSTNDCNIVVVPTEEVNYEVVNQGRNDIIDNCRKKYCVTREEVEKSLFNGETNEVKLEENVKVKFNSVPPQKKDSTSTELISSVEIPLSASSYSPKQEEIRTHRYLQTLIKKMAELRGFVAVIEEPTVDGNGRVDVGLTKNNEKIACEICVTTPDSWELHNVEKGLASGYDLVCVCSLESKTLHKIRGIVEQTLSEPYRSRVLYFQPEALFMYFDQRIANDPKAEVRVKGYRVKVEYNAVSEKEGKVKKENIIKILKNKAGK